MGRNGTPKRRHRRYAVKDLHGTLVYAMDAEILNLSLTGMAIETSHNLHVGSSYVLRLPHHGNEIRLRARIQWCHLVRTSPNKRGEVVPIYHAGIDFRDALGDIAKDLLGFIEENIVVELERRIIGRFRLRSREPINLQTSHVFEVLKISQSGMLIRTDLRPPLESTIDIEWELRGQPAGCRGRIAYVAPPAGRDGEERSELGVEFLHFDDRSRHAVEALIEELIE